MVSSNKVGMIMCILCFLDGAILAGLWGRKLGSRGSGY